MIDLRECKKGDKLLTKHGTILEYVESLDPEIHYYSHRIKYPDGSFGTRVDSGHVMKNESRRLESDEDIIEILDIQY